MHIVSWTTIQYRAACRLCAGGLPMGLAVALLGACQRAPAVPPPHNAPAASAAHAPGTVETEANTSLNVILDQLLADDPGWGRSLGLHQYDGKVPSYSVRAIESRIARLQHWAEQVSRLQGTVLSPDAALDAALLRSNIESQLFQLREWEQWRKNPLFYQSLFSVNDYLDRDYAPLAERARQLVAHEEAALLEVGHVLTNLAAPLPRPFVETAVKVYAGYAEYLRGDVVRLLAGVGDAAFRARFDRANTALAAQALAISKHLAAIELPRSDMNYALGPERYARFVEIQEGLAMPLDAFAKLAETDLAANKRAYELLAKSVQTTRPNATELLPTAGSITEAARAFLMQHELMTVPDAPPPLVRETPPFMRWNQAFLVAPGPFERPGLEAYYYITLPDPSWSPRKQHEYMMSRGTLISTTVHETYPGHFLQSVFTRNARTRVQRSVSSYSFSEGWAHYVEQLMTDMGFLGDSAETRLGQLSDALLRNCRFRVSIGLHARGMTLAEAERSFMDDCHQDPASAHEQAVRGTFDPGYFAYTLGKLQILALRNEAQQKLGDRFSFKRFHDALLSYGTPPVPLIHARVLADLER